MEVKMFEIRDAGTFIPAIGVLLVPLSGNPFADLHADDEVNEAERYLLRRAGFVFDPAMVNLTRVVDAETHYDPSHWGRGTRTMHTAHRYIVEHWNQLKSGAVVDVQTIIGETTMPKVSERITAPI